MHGIWSYGMHFRCALRGMDILSYYQGRQPFQNWFSLPSKQGPSLKGKNLLPGGANSFLLE